MKKIVSVSIFLFLLASMLLSGAGQEPSGIALPDDPSAVVISMDSHGYWSDLSRTNPNPILADDEDFALAAEKAGLSYPQLVDRIARHGMKAPRD